MAQEQVHAKTDFKQICAVSKPICPVFVKAVETAELCWFSKVPQIFLQTAVLMFTRIIWKANKSPYIHSFMSTLTILNSYGY